jgi:hypothetical protein
LRSRSNRAFNRWQLADSFAESRSEVSSAL